MDTVYLSSGTRIVKHSICIENLNIIINENQIKRDQRRPQVQLIIHRILLLILIAQEIHGILETTLREKIFNWMALALILCYH